MSTDEPTPGASAVSTADQPVSAKDRLSWLKRNVVVWLLALLLLVIAIVGASFAFGLFSSSTASAANTFTAGSLEATSDPPGAIFSVTGMLPGDVETGNVTIQNSGDASGTFTLTSENLTDTPGTGGGNLSDVLQLVITEDPGTASESEVYTGPINAPISENLGSWAANESHDFHFEITFPSSADNTFQGSSMTVDFVWTVNQS